MNYKARKAGSIVLGLFSAAGTVITAILVAKETPKAIEKIKELKEKNTKVKVLDYVKALTPIYWPAGLMCLGTIASTTVSQVISRKTEASLIATSTVLNQGWNRYKGKVKDILGITNERKITNEIAKEDYSNNLPSKIENVDGKVLYWEEHLGFFSCKPEDLMAAICDLNQRLHTPDPDPEGTFYWSSLYFLMEDSKAKVYDKTKLKASEEIGWTLDYLCEVYELACMWVHPFFTRVIKKGTGELLFVKLEFFEEPIFLLESEKSRYHYKSREDYEHEAECDMHDADAYSLYYNGTEDPDQLYTESALLNTKEDCDPENDNGRRFIPTNQPIENEFLEDNQDLPSEKDIPTL